MEDIQYLCSCHNPLLQQTSLQLPSKYQAHEAPLHQISLPETGKIYLPSREKSAGYEASPDETDDLRQGRTECFFVI